MLFTLMEAAYQRETKQSGVVACDKGTTESTVLVSGVGVGTPEAAELLEAWRSHVARSCARAGQSSHCGSAMPAEAKAEKEEAKAAKVLEKDEAKAVKALEKEEAKAAKGQDETR